MFPYDLYGPPEMILHNFTLNMLNARVHFTKWHDWNVPDKSNHSTSWWPSNMLFWHRNASDKSKNSSNFLMTWRHAVEVSWSWSMIFRKTFLLGDQFISCDLVTSLPDLDLYSRIQCHMGVSLVETRFSMGWSTPCLKSNIIITVTTCVQIWPIKCYNSTIPKGKHDQLVTPLTNETVPPLSEEKMLTETAAWTESRLSSQKHTYLLFSYSTDYHNDPKFSDRHVWANNVDPDLTTPNSCLKNSLSCRQHL